MNHFPLFRFGHIGFGTLMFLFLLLADLPATAQVRFEYLYNVPSPLTANYSARGMKGVAEIRYCEADNGYITAGSATDQLAGDEKILVVRTKSDGKALWVRSYNFTTQNEKGTSVKELPDGSGFIVTGSTENAGQIDIFLMKIDCDGNVVWAKLYDHRNNAQEMGYDIIVAQSTSANNPYDFVVAGSVVNTSSSATDGYLMRTDATGNIIWSGRYNFQQFAPATSSEWFLSLTEATPTPTIGGTPQLVGDIIAAGGHIDLAVSPSRSQGLLARIDGATGQLLGPGNPLTNNLQQLATYGSTENEEFYSVIELHSDMEAGNIAAIGYSASRDIYGDIYMVKTAGNPAISLVQSVIYSSGTDITDIGRDLKEVQEGFPLLGSGVNSGNLVITGSTMEKSAGLNNDAYLLGIQNTNLAPITNSGKLYGDPTPATYEEGFSIIETQPYGSNTRGFAISGQGGPERDLYLVKTDVDGTTGCEDTWHPPFMNPTWQVDHGLPPVIMSVPDVRNENVMIDEGSEDQRCDKGPESTRKSIPGGLLMEESGEGEAGMGTYPNPVKGGSDITLSLPNAKWGQMTMTVTTTAGKEVRKESFPGMETPGEIRLKTDGLDAGTYIVTLSDGTHTCSARVVIR